MLPLTEEMCSCITPRQVDREPGREQTDLKAHIVLNAFSAMFYLYHEATTLSLCALNTYCRMVLCHTISGAVSIPGNNQAVIFQRDHSQDFSVTELTSILEVSSNTTRIPTTFFTQTHIAKSRSKIYSRPSLEASAIRRKGEQIAVVINLSFSIHNSSRYCWKYRSICSEKNRTTCTPNIARLKIGQIKIQLTTLAEGCGFIEQ